MKKILNIKWELIIAIILGLTTILIWSINETYLKDWRIMILCFIHLIAFVFWFISYDKLREIRLTLKDNW